MMKNLKKMLSLMLAIMLASSLVIPASASSADDDSTVTVPEVVYDPGNSYLYWVDYMGSSTPTITYDCYTRQYYLSFRLSTADKLSALTRSYLDAFQLQSALDTLIDLNDIDKAIWQKPDWREKSIGAQLSKSTVTALKMLRDLDAYGALQLIQSRPEYRDDEKLQEQVDYAMTMLKSYRYRALKGLSQLTAVGESSNPLVLDEATHTPAEVIYMVQARLKGHPELAVLGEVYSLAVSGVTSNYTTTFHMTDVEKIEDLWQRTIAATSYCWQGRIQRLDNFTFAVPFPEGSVYQWPGTWEKPAGLEPPDAAYGLPTGATGG